MVQKSKPNIVFILADQLAASFLGCYGSSINSTPNLDNLAANGVRFDRFYATCPLCAPNRATILTGRSPVIHGLVTNNYTLRTDCPTYANILRKSGYTTGGFGKFHQTPMTLPVPKSLEYLGFDKAVVSEDPKWGPWIDWIRKNNPDFLDRAIAMTNSHGGNVGCFPDYELLQGATAEDIEIKKVAFEKYLKPVLEASPWERMYTSILPSQLHDTKFITDLGLEFIKNCVTQNSNPFFCHISYVDPHDPYDPPVPYDTMFRPEDMKETIPAEWVEQGPEFMDKYRDDYLNFRKISDDEAAVRKMRALYHGSLKFLDDQIGRVLDYLRTSGLWENTIIVFSTDHGDLMGDHGLIAKGEKHYDSSIRCPLIIGGGLVHPGIASQLACSLDLYPTFCEWADADKDILPPIEGNSLVKLCSGESSETFWDEIAITFDECHTVITNDGFRLTRYTVGNDGQMFNLFNDSDEQNNLYHNPDYVEKKVELLERLIKASLRPYSIPQFRNLQDFG